MSGSESTRWSLIRRAAEGPGPDRSEFAAVYEPVARAYLHARWNGTPLVSDIDDAVQEVFVECFREDGALTRAEAGRPGGFGAFFYGIVRNVALHAERTRARRVGHLSAPDAGLDEIPADQTGLSTAFDRAWAEALVKEASRRQRARAEASGGEAWRRFELICRRHQDGLPIRDIATEWNVPAEHLHREYAKAKREFFSELKAVVAGHFGGSNEEVEAECRRLYEILR